MDQEEAFLSAIAAGDDTARLVFADWLEERGDERAAWVRDPNVFAWMGPTARSPVPELLAAIEAGDRDRQRAAVELLPRFASPAVVAALLAVIERVEGEEGGWRCLPAGEALSKMGAAVLPIVPRLVELIRTRPDNSRAPALALSAVPGALGATELVPELIERLSRDVDWDVGCDYETAMALGAFGPLALAAVPEITRRLARYDGDGAGDALIAIGPEATTAILEAASELDDDFMIRAVPALRGYGEAAAPQLRASLSSENEGVRALAAMALAPLDPHAAFPHLLDAIPFGHRGDYFDALGRALEQARPAAACFVAELRAAAEAAPGVLAPLLEDLQVGSSGLDT
jgi:uncharacterized protein (TIGR02996 family)